MKKFKIILVLIILLLVTGCSGTYNITIGKDLDVKEELTVTLEGEASNYNKIDDLLKSKKVSEDDYYLTTKDNDLGVNYIKEYDSIEDYLLNSFLYKQLFSDISYNNDKKDLTLEASGIFNNTTSKLNNSNSIKLLQINVTTPIEVIEDNSDSISENTYSWTIDNKTKEKDIFISLDVADKKLDTRTTIILCTLAVTIIIIVIILLKRLLDTRKL